MNQETRQLNYLAGLVMFAFFMLVICVADLLFDLPPMVVKTAITAATLTSLAVMV